MIVVIINGCGGSGSAVIGIRVKKRVNEGVLHLDQFLYISNSRYWM
jgi:hypothetical protein